MFPPLNSIVQTAAQHTPSSQSSFNEAYREGYLHALDDVREALKGIEFSDPFCTITPAMVVEKVRESRANADASLAIAKASGGAS